MDAVQFVYSASYCWTWLDIYRVVQTFRETLYIEPFPFFPFTRMLIVSSESILSKFLASSIKRKYVNVHVLFVVP